MTRQNYVLPRMVAALEAEKLGLTIPQLMGALRESERVVRYTLAMLTEATPRKAYICDWRQGHIKGSPMIGVYALGDKEDVPRPTTRMSVAERVRRHRARKKLEAEVQAAQVSIGTDLLTACLYGRFDPAMLEAQP